MTRRARPSESIAGEGNGVYPVLRGMRTISILAENRPGVLAKVTEMFRRRSYNIMSLAAGTTEVPGVSRIVLVVDADQRVEQIIKQLNKILEVVKVSEVTGADTVDRQLALIKVSVTPGTQPEVFQMAQVFRANVVDVSDTTVTLEVTGRPDKVDALQQLLQRHGIREMVRTGQVTLVRGSRVT